MLSIARDNREGETWSDLGCTCDMVVYEATNTGRGCYAATSTVALMVSTTHWYERRIARWWWSAIS